MSSIDNTGKSGSSPLWQFGRWLLAGTGTNALLGPDSRFGNLLTLGGIGYELLKQKADPSELTDAVGGDKRPHTLENVLSNGVEGLSGIVTSLFGEEGGKKFNAMREDVMSEGGLDRMKEKVLGEEGLGSDSGKLMRWGGIGLAVYFGAKILGNITNRLFSPQMMGYPQMMPEFAGQFGGQGFGGQGFDPRTALADPRLQAAMNGGGGFGGWG